MRDYVLYLLARLAVLVIVVALTIWIFGFNLIAMIAAILISAFLSYLMLAGLRMRATDGLIERNKNRKARAPKVKKVKKDSDEAIEDAQVDGSQE